MSFSNSSFPNFPIDHHANHDCYNSSVTSSSLHEECGVVGVWNSNSSSSQRISVNDSFDTSFVAPSDEDGDEAARFAFYALFALQHRGQEAAGIAVLNGKNIKIFKKLGLIANIFTEEKIKTLQGMAAIGHTRYSTTGENTVQNIQPFYILTQHGPISLAHNGNLVNAKTLRQKLLRDGIGLSSTSDTEVMIMMLAAAKGATWQQRIASCMREWKGSYSIVLLTEEGLYVARDPWGFRPLCSGLVDDGVWAVASESCALLTLGCSNIKEVERGEILAITNEGLERTQGIPPIQPSALCIFEYIYFARPDSIWNNVQIHNARVNFGSALADVMPVEADAVIAIPDSSRSCAIGYSQASGIKYDEGFSKNRYIGRTFIEPTQKLREQGVAMKFNVLEKTVKDKRLIVVDDSIVRGTTIKRLIKMLRNAGARSVHIRIASPPIKFPCYMGVDMGGVENLIASSRSIEEIKDFIGADSLAFLSFEKMLSSMKKEGATCGFCCACFDGNYPCNVSEASGKSDFD